MQGFNLVCKDIIIICVRTADYTAVENRKNIVILLIDFIKG
jgi:hypothetical protein